MLAKIFSSAVVGIEAFAIEVEVDIANGLPALNIVGLPDTACRESQDRVRAAIKNSGFHFPSKRITINLAPADIRKEGAAYDLAIAIGILVAAEVIPVEAVSGKVFCGELSLDGKLRGVPGILPRASEIARDKPCKEFFIPPCNVREALCVEGIVVYGTPSLLVLTQHLRGEVCLSPEKPEERLPKTKEKRKSEKSVLDFSDIKGQWHARRGIEIAAAGGHNLIMIGPPGSGKTMLAKRIPGILSEISREEAIEATKIHSVVGLISQKNGLVERRPFRDPHHTISAAAMVGGGSTPKPGEISLAHQGVLFLDEIAEYNRSVLEVLRQPLEEGKITISRTASTLTFPARFMLVAAMNPCPCGYYTDPKKECNCSPVQIKNYMSKVSGPLLDRIDIQLEVPRLKSGEITSKQISEASQVIRERVEAARELQRQRYTSEHISCNAELEARHIERYCTMSAEAESLLKMAIEELGFSARAFHKSLKVARTIADLEKVGSIEAHHVSEAIHYRTLDRSVWGR